MLEVKADKKMHRLLHILMKNQLLKPFVFHSSHYKYSQYNSYFKFKGCTCLHFIFKTVVITSSTVVLLNNNFPSWICCILTKKYWITVERNYNSTLHKTFSASSLAGWKCKVKISLQNRDKYLLPFLKFVKFASF